MNKKTFVTVAIVALLVQIIFPVWWGVVTVSFWGFFIEKILEGGLFKEIIIGLDQTGNSIIGYCLENASCITSTLRYGLFSIYSILALIVPIWSFFSAKGTDSKQIYTKKKNIVFLIINILTVILAIMFVIMNKGFIPRL